MISIFLVPFENPDICPSFVSGIPPLSDLSDVRDLEEQKLEEFGSDFPAFLRWFESSQLDFKAAIAWLGTVSKFRYLDSTKVLVCLGKIGIDFVLKTARQMINQIDS